MHRTNGAEFFLSVSRTVVRGSHSLLIACRAKALRPDGRFFMPEREQMVGNGFDERRRSTYENQRCCFREKDLRREHVPVHAASLAAPTGWRAAGNRMGDKQPILIGGEPIQLTPIDDVFEGP